MREVSPSFLSGAISGLIHEDSETLTWSETDALAEKIMALPEMQRVAHAYWDLRR